MDRFIDNYYNGSVDIDRYNYLLNQAAQKLNVPSDWLSSIFWIETAFSMNPYENRNPNAVGLLQFTDIAIKQMVNDKILPSGFVKEDIKNYSIDQVMDMVVMYFQMNKKRFDYESIRTVENMYLLVLWPAAVNKPDDYVLQTSGQSAALIASQNPAWDINKDGKITAGEIRNNYRKKLPFSITANFMSPEEEAAELKKKRNIKITLIILAILLLVIGLIIIFTWKD